MHSSDSVETGRPLPFTLRPVTPGGPAPLWNGRGFTVGEGSTRVLAYEIGESGWTDDLTTIHEQTAGEEHYIDRASRGHTLGQLLRWISNPCPAVIDIGCSSGLMLNPMRKAFPGGSVIGADYVPGPLHALANKMPDLPLIQFDLARCPLPDRSFDGVVLLNVLEHMEDDRAALSQVFRILKPGGVAVIEVPAGPHLYDVYDKVDLHHRRYRMQEILDKSVGAGFEIVAKSHLGFFLYPGFRIAKKRGQRLLSADPEVQKAHFARSLTMARSNPLLHSLMVFEARVREVVYLPVGIRCMLTCRRRAES